MTADKRKRLRKLRIVWLALILVALAGTTAIPVKVVRPVIGSNGQPVIMQDESEKMEVDPWGDFKVNWMAYSLAYTGFGIAAYALGSYFVAEIYSIRNKGYEDEQ